MHTMGILISSGSRTFRCLDRTSHSHRSSVYFLIILDLMTKDVHAVRIGEEAANPMSSGIRMLDLL